MVVKQICYYNESDLNKELNNPSDLKGEDLVEGLIFTDAVYNEIQIRAFPGISVTINGQEVLIGEVGVYNILYRENLDIISVKIDRESLQKIQQFDEAFLVITVMRDGN